LARFAQTHGFHRPCREERDAQFDGQHVKAGETVENRVELRWTKEFALQFHDERIANVFVPDQLRQKQRRQGNMHV
jgi:hypothetical protein